MELLARDISLLFLYIFGMIVYQNYVIPVYLMHSNERD